MRYRTYKNTELTVSEIGFGLWTISTGWWGNFTEGEATGLMHKAFDLGVTLFDAADTYGNGLSEELIAKAFPKQRDEIVIATKVGYDFVHHGEARGRGQREIPQDFSPEAITRATDAALKRDISQPIDGVIGRGVGCVIGSKRSTSCAFSKIPSAHSGKPRCNGCSPTIGSNRRYPTFIMKNSALSSRKRRSASR